MGKLQFSCCECSWGSYCCQSTTGWYSGDSVKAILMKLNCWYVKHTLYATQPSAKLQQIGLLPDTKLTNTRQVVNNCERSMHVAVNDPYAFELQWFYQSLARILGELAEIQITLINVRGLWMKLQNYTDDEKCSDSCSGHSWSSWKTVKLNAWTLRVNFGLIHGNFMFGKNIF